MISPAVARRRLGAELRRLRIEADIPVEKAAEALECSASKISRLETGVGVPRTRDVRDLIDLIGGEAEDRRKELLELAEEGRAQAWYHEFNDLLDPTSSLLRFIDLESGASEELTYGGAWVPGLLQTPAYTEALFRALRPVMSDEDVQRFVALRMGRKIVLTRRTSPMRLTAVVDEAVLLRRVGGPSVMREQLVALRTAALEPSANVDVRLLPFSAGIHRLLAGDLTVLRFDGEEEDVVLAEGHAAQGFEERPAEVQNAIGTFQSALKLTSGGTQFAHRLSEVIDVLVTES